MFEIKVQPCSAIVVGFSANISASVVVTLVRASDVKTSKIIKDEMEINSMIRAQCMHHLQSKMEKNAFNQGQASVSKHQELSAQLSWVRLGLETVEDRRAIGAQIL